MIARRLVALGMAIGVAVGVAVGAAACGRGGDTSAGPVLVFAAADLRDALSDIAASYRASGGDSVTLVFGATNDLAAQIEAGAPADAFFAAEERVIEELARRGRVVADSRRPYAIGRLALVTPRDGVGAAGTPRTIADLARPTVRTVAIADPAHAPYGRAARQALQGAGVWDAVRPKLVLAANVNQALVLVESGNADAGVVAASVAGGGHGVNYAIVDPHLHLPIRQALAITTSATHAAAARRFVTYASGDAGRAVLRRYGFAIPGDTSDVAPARDAAARDTTARDTAPR